MQIVKTNSQFNLINQIKIMFPINWKNKFDKIRLINRPYLINNYKIKLIPHILLKRILKPIPILTTSTNFSQRIYPKKL